jgi:flavin-dependent dehydrogenase
MRDPLVVVIGAGPAGSSAALALARLGIAVLLVESGKHRPAVGEILPANARPLLQRLGLRDSIEREGFLPSVGSWSVWGSPEPWGRDSLFDRYGHGWHLDRRRFDALLRRSAEAAGAQLCLGTALTAAVPRVGGGFDLTVATRAGAPAIAGGRVPAALVIDASGRAACFARALGIRRRPIDRLIGIAAYVARRRDAPEEPAAILVEAVETGWWYSAPLPQAQLAAVFMTDADQARDGVTRIGPWLDQLASAPLTGGRAARYGAGLVGLPVVVPASSARLDQTGGQDWLAIGDAACTYDPLASQGLVAAMQSGLEAAAACVERLGGRRDALADIAERQSQAWQTYTGERSKYYGQERRWPSATFWQRRHVPERQAA